MICRFDIAGRMRTMWRFWDNWSVYHTATSDYEGLGERLGHRAVSIGERPLLDVGSKSRQEALREWSTEGNRNVEDGLNGLLIMP